MPIDKELVKRVFLALRAERQTDVVDFLGVNQSMVSRWLSGKSLPGLDSILRVVTVTGVDANWLLTGEGPSGLEWIDGPAEVADAWDARRTDAPKVMSNGVFKEPPRDPRESRGLDYLQPMGEAMADTTGGAMAERTHEEIDPVQVDLGVGYVRVRGESMSPVILDGQVVRIGPEGFWHRNAIVVVEVSEEDPHAKPGTYCKRCASLPGEELLYFTSMNAVDSPIMCFSAWEKNCRVWEVIAVEFAGQGKPPE